MTSEGALVSTEHIDACSGETFIVTSYNEVSITIRKVDGYINATKVGTDLKRKTRTYISSVTFQKICREWRDIQIWAACEPYYKLSEGISDSLMGFYVHPSLIHFIIHWADNQYAFKVARMMDLVNEEFYLRQISLDQKISELEAHVQRLNDSAIDLLGRTMDGKPLTSTSEVNVMRSDDFETVTYNDITLLRHIKTGYYNATEVCRVNRKQFRDLRRIVDFDEKLSAVSTCAGIPAHVLIVEFSTSNEFRGSYVHPRLLNYVCMWCNTEYATKVDHIMDLVNEELHLRQITLDQKISEQEELIVQLTRRNAEIETKYTRVNECMNKDRPGTIVLTRDVRSTSTFRLNKSSVIRTARSDRDTVIPDVYNVEDACRLANYYTKYNLVPSYNIKWVGYNRFSTDAVENIIKLINDIRSFALDITVDYERKMLDISKMYLYTERTPQATKAYLSKMFEYYCAIKYGFDMYSSTVVETLGLTKKDIGCDLIQLDLRMLAQCKYYTSLSNPLRLQHLTTFINFCDTFDNYEHYLFITDTTPIAFELPDHIQCIIIPDEEFKTFVEEFKARADIEIDNSVVESREHLEHELSISALASHEKRSSRIASYSDSLEKQTTPKSPEDICASVQLRGYRFTAETIIKFRDYVKTLITKNGIPFYEAVDNINITFHIDPPFNPAQFGICFSDLYRKQHREGLPLFHGVKMLYPVVTSTILDEEEFIIDYIKMADVKTIDYIAIHNEHFGTHYTLKQFTVKFMHLFAHNKTCLKRRTVDGEKTSILFLKDYPYRYEIYKEYISNLLIYRNEINLRLPLPELVEIFNREFSTYESAKSLALILRELGFVITYAKIRKSEQSSSYCMGLRTCAFVYLK